MLLTYNQAKSHLQSLLKLCVVENQYLACVRMYLKDVEYHVSTSVRADTLSSHEQLLELFDLEKKVEASIDAFLGGRL